MRAGEKKADNTPTKGRLEIDLERESIRIAIVDTHRTFSDLEVNICTIIAVNAQGSLWHLASDTHGDAVPRSIQHGTRRAVLERLLDIAFKLAEEVQR